MFYSFTQAYFLIQWYFRQYNHDLKWSMICYIFLKGKEGKAIQWIRVNWNMCNHITTLAKSNTSLLQLALHLLSLFFFLFLFKLFNNMTIRFFWRIRHAENTGLPTCPGLEHNTFWYKNPSCKIWTKTSEFFPLCLFLSIQIQN